MQPYVCGVFRRLQKSQEAIQQHVGGLLTGCSNLSHYQISVFPDLRLNNTTAQAEEVINDKNVHHVNVLLVGRVAFMTTIRPYGFTTFFNCKTKYFITSRMAQPYSKPSHLPCSQFFQCQRGERCYKQAWISSKEAFN